MRGWLVPRGPESVAVYWVRRLIVLVSIALLILAVVGISSLVKRASSADVLPDETPTTQPTPQVTRSPAEPSPEPNEALTATADLPDCTASQLQLSIEGPNTTPTVGDAEFALSVFNSGESCHLASASAHITSGEDAIWTNEGCPAWGFLPEETELAAEATTSMTFTWPTKRAQGCTLVDTPLGEGTYVVTADVNGASARLVTHLRD